MKCRLVLLLLLQITIVYSEDEETSTDSVQKYNTTSVNRGTRRGNNSKIYYIKDREPKSKTKLRVLDDITERPITINDTNDSKAKYSNEEHEVEISDTREHDDKIAKIDDKITFVQTNPPSFEEFIRGQRQRTSHETKKAESTESSEENEERTPNTSLDSEEEDSRSKNDDSEEDTVEVMNRKAQSSENHDYRKYYGPSAIAHHKKREMKNIFDDLERILIESRQNNLDITKQKEKIDWLLNKLLVETQKANMIHSGSMQKPKVVEPNSVPLMEYNYIDKLSSIAPSPIIAKTLNCGNQRWGCVLNPFQEIATAISRKRQIAILSNLVPSYGLGVYKPRLHSYLLRRFI